LTKNDRITISENCRFLLFLLSNPNGDKSNPRPLTADKPSLIPSDVLRKSLESKWKRISLGKKILILPFLMFGQQTECSNARGDFHAFLKTAKVSMTIALASARV